MNESRKSTLLVAAIVACAVLVPARSHAQWWGARAPADYEECAERAEKAASKEAKAAQLSDCGVKFAGRRKAGGGYSYFDFMQNRHFDIAGPNPTPEEQRHIDQQYADYLARERQSAIAAAFSQKQQQLQRAAPEAEKKSAVPLPASKPRAATVGSASSRPRNTSCASDSFSCNWPRLAEGIKDFKKLFGSSPDKAKRSRPSSEFATSNQ
ncbi:hypothetical protein [Bradyrhizobium sp.]|uniref:hypothetical protein n=1 Tax=Bradyrhizobium sp. TaxID=376 RepID=UPI002E0B1FC3|nr:hypothetical protein [Bradyrhizobium sp.]